MSSKVAILADLHCGVPGRISDIIWAMRVAREYCKVAGIDVAFVLGDMFHDRVNLSIDVLCAVTRFFEETREVYGQKWITFPGNHDMFLRHSWQINSLAPLRKHLTVIEDVKIVTVEDKRFWILPFIQYEKSFMKVLRKLDDRYEDGDVLLTHVGVRGATLNTCFLLKDWSIVTFEYSKFRKIFTGHFHSRQSIAEQVYYPGSLIPFKFDEGDVSHGFYVYDFKEDIQKFVNIWKAGAKLIPNEKAPPQFCTFMDGTLDGKTVDDVTNNIIRVALQREYTLEEKRQIKDRLVGLGAVSVRFINLMQKLQKKPEEVLETSQPQRNLFKVWTGLDEKGVEDLDLGVLAKVHDDVVHDGDELYAVEETEIG
jgi:DNA repair exonuclease SbcCD nuclease subunit